MGYSPRGGNELDATERLTLATKSPGVPSSRVSLIAEVWTFANRRA